MQIINIKFSDNTNEKYQDKLSVLISKNNDEVKFWILEARRC